MLQHKLNLWHDQSVGNRWVHLTLSNLINSARVPRAVTVEIYQNCNFSAIYKVDYRYLTGEVKMLSQEQIRFMCILKVCEIADISKTSVYTIPDFPKQIKINGAGAVMQGGGY